MEIEFETGKYGEKAVLQSPWSEDIYKEIRSRQCPELEINDAKGWKGTDLSFLADLPWLKSLKILDFKLESVEPIHALHELRELEVSTYCDTPLRFSSFPKLEDCGLEWRPKAATLFDCVTLNSLFINRYRGTNFGAFSRLANLETLTVLNAPIESLEGIEVLVKLRRLCLGNLKKLRSLRGVESLTKLVELDVSSCRQIGSINEVGNLVNLRKLHIIDDGELASLAPLNALERLESVMFYESTNILDGDLSPLMRLKNLSRISFQNRRHYSHKREQFGVAYSQQR